MGPFRDQAIDEVSDEATRAGVHLWVTDDREELCRFCPSTRDSRAKLPDARGSVRVVHRPLRQFFPESRILSLELDQPQ
ncbi:MAG: hypothetical protein QOE16_1948 [Microbacteriaceae bacterium]|jgi:hypothetical protein|nr:hypothetical protein [Microbacteriaceae bacterium]